jgi:hypothetical protein
VEDVWGGRGDSGILVRIKGVNGRAEPRVAHSRGRWWQKVGDGGERGGPLVGDLLWALAARWLWLLGRRDWFLIRVTLCAP